MLQKVQSYIQAHRLLQPGSPVVVGVSGGADSVALWHVLRSLGYDCAMAHCNFHLRGAESDRDEQFVRRLAEEHGTPFYKTDFDTTTYAAQHGISIEMAARDLRYAWFDGLRQRLHAQAIAVAHHADDNIETLLLNLVRGTGLRGLTGIPRRNGAVVRPLLGCSRQEIEQYLADHHLPHVTDSTNVSPDYRRNRVRHAVLPLLESINPAMRTTLYATMERLDEAYTLYRQSVDLADRDIVTRTSDGGMTLRIDRLSSHPACRTLLFEWLRPYGFSPATIRQVADSLTGEAGTLFYSPTHSLLKDRECLIVQPHREDCHETEFHIGAGTARLHIPLNMRFTRLERDAQFQPSKAPHTVHVDFDRLTFPLTLRHWREGDAFRPFGMTGMKKVSDFFIDRKLSRFDKERCWLLLSGNDIVWIVGLRTDDRFKVTPRTRHVLEIAIEPES